MSILPILYSNWWENLDRPHRLFDQHFGHGLHPEELLAPLQYIERYVLPASNRSGRRSNSKGDLAASTIKADKNKFQVILDVQQFKPEEINVKVVDKYVVVEASHEEKQDEHGWISRQFCRKYLVPEQCDIEQVKTSLSSDGILTIVAPRKAEMIEGKKERVIMIEHTGKPAIRPTTECPAKAENCEATEECKKVCDKK